MKVPRTRKSKKTSVNKAVKTYVQHAIKVKRNSKCYMMDQSTATSSLNFPSGALRYNEEIGRIPKYDVVSVATQAGSLSQARVSNRIRLESVKITIGMVNLAVAFSLGVRVLLFRNDNANEVYNTAGTNLAMDQFGLPQSFSADYHQGQMQRFNKNLIKSKKDLLIDKVFWVNPDLGNNASLHVVPFRNVVVINKRINREIVYEGRPDVANSRDYKGPRYFLVWHIITPSASGDESGIDIDVQVDQKYTEDA